MFDNDIIIFLTFQLSGSPEPEMREEDGGRALEERRQTFLTKYLMLIIMLCRHDHAMLNFPDI